MKPAYIIRDTDSCAVQGWAYTTDLNKSFGMPTYLVNQIFVLPSQRGKGKAKELLTLITKDADCEGTWLILDFSPEEFGSEAERLMKLYKSFGFYWDDKLRGMKRMPNDSPKA